MNWEVIEGNSYTLKYNLGKVNYILILDKNHLETKEKLEKNLESILRKIGKVSALFFCEEASEEAIIFNNSKETITKTLRKYGFVEELVTYPDIFKLKEYINSRKSMKVNTFVFFYGSLHENEIKIAIDFSQNKF